MEGDGQKHNKIKYHIGGDNPPNGVVFNYYLKNTTDSSKVSVTIFDKQGKAIKTFGNNEKKDEDKLDFVTGMNQFVWDMHYPEGEKIEGMVLWNGGIDALIAAPGKYSARFRFEKDSVNVPFVIKQNPAFDISESDYDARVEFLLQVRDKYNEVQRAIKDIREVNKQIGDLSPRISRPETKDIKTLADSISKKLTAIEESLYQTKAKSGEDVLNYPIRLNDKLAGLYGVASSGDNPPSKQARETFTDLSNQSDLQLQKLKKVMSKEVPALNKLLLSGQVPLIGVKTDSMPPVVN